MGTLRLPSVATLLGLALIFVAWGSSEAQPSAELPAANAEAKTARGRAEVLKKAQTTWTTLAQGARLAEGDQIRTFQGASVEFSLPDGSSMLVAENTRYVITKLQYNPRSRERNFGFHIVVGKIKADVARAAVEAVRARQANFFISSPNGVAAVRGTIVVLLFNPATGQTLVACLPSQGQPAAQAVVTFISLATGTVVSVTGGYFVTLVPGQPPSSPARLATLPQAIQQALFTAANTATAGSDLLVAVTVPPPPPIPDGDGPIPLPFPIDGPPPPPPPTPPT